MDFEHRQIDLAEKPATFVKAYAEAVGGDSTKRAQVPLLECGSQEKVVESDVVTKFVAQQLGSSDSMYPQNDLPARARIDRFLQKFDSAVQEYYQYLGARNAEQAQQGKISFCQALGCLDEELVVEKEGRYCLGDTFSVAECIAAPWVHRFQIVLPYFRGVRVQDLGLPEAVTQWMEAVLDRPSVQATNGPTDYILESTKGYFVNYITPGAAGDIAVVSEEE